VYKFFLTRNYVTNTMVYVIFFEGKMISDKQIEEYVNAAFTEEVIRRYEEQILQVMKKRQEKYPSDQNDSEWLNYSNYVCRRRCQRKFP